MAALVLGCGPERAAPGVPPALRVVSLSATASEVLVHLGAAGALVAVDPASRNLDGLGHLPVADLAAAIELSPHLVVTPALGKPEAHLAERLRARGGELIEFAPHDFDDAYELCRTLGLRLGRQAAAHTWVREHSRDLAVLSAASFGERRPRVAAVVGVSPLELAGGHSFITDLIEIAGAESVTHGNDDPRVALDPAELRADAPDLVLVTRSVPLSSAERRTLRAQLGDSTPIASLALDDPNLWLHGAIDKARQLRERIRLLVGARGFEPRTF